MENPLDRSDADVGLYTKAAEILTDRINQRLQRAQSPAPTAANES
jgi:hypothetical protein